MAKLSKTQPLFPGCEPNRATMLANAVFSTNRGQWDTTVDDPGLRCALMAQEVFTGNKCWLYCSSGSKTCVLCSKRPQLRTIQQILKEVEMASKRGICGQCGKERSLVAHGKCYTCNGYDKPKEKQGKFASGVELPSPVVKAKPEALEQRRKVIAERASKPFQTMNEVRVANGLPAIATHNPYAGPIVTFKTEVDNTLFNKIAERARKNRREVGDEMLVLAEIALDYGNLGKDGGTITKVKDMIERMKSYPMPHAGSSQEVYQLTLQVIQARVEELAA